jgi:dTDP-4-amino-4,6-dideoxygalactose transaminase
MVVFQDGELAERARRMRSHGMTTLSYERAQGHATRYDVLEVGYNYRLDDIRAAIALVQLDKLSPDIEQRARVRQWYIDRLAQDPRLTIPYLNHQHRSSHYIMPVVINDGGEERRDSIRKILADNSIQTSVHYPAVHHFASYRSPVTTLPQTELIVDHEITLPMFAALTSAQVDRICGTLLDALDRTS